MKCVALLALSCALAACGTKHAADAPPATLDARRGSPAIDGDLDEPCWRATPRTARFVDARSGAAQLPYTDARAVWDDAALTLAIYAADQDLVRSDAVGVVLRRADGRAAVVTVDPSGRVRWHVPGGADQRLPDGVRAAVDVDGTVDVSSDEDEEWVVELRLPWRALGMRAPAAVRADLFRRDRPRDAAPRELAWIPWRDGAPERLATLGAIRPR